MLNEDLFKKITHENVKLLKVLFVDILGDLKCVFVPTDCFKRALQNELMIDGSSICGLSSVDKADLYLKIDDKSLKIIDKEAYVFSYVCKSNGDNYECDSRYILKKQIENYWENHKFIFKVGFEPEFYILKILICTVDMKKTLKSNFSLHNISISHQTGRIYCHF